MIDLSHLSLRERLAAEQAVLLTRALDKAAEEAPHGRGLECLEKVIVDDGFRHLRAVLADAVSAREEAQRRGPAFEAACAVAGRSSRRRTAARS